MNQIFFHIRILIALSILLCGCNDGLQTYVYAIVNDTSGDSLISVNYTVLDDTAKNILLQPGEEAIIAERADVPSKDIWDVETSKSLYKIKEIAATYVDSSSVSEQLSFRKFWDGPITSDGKGKYVLHICDSLLSLHRQNGYIYYVQSSFDDTLFITSYLVNQSRRTDTLVGKVKGSIGSSDIYSYDEEQNMLPKYKTQKLTGIYSITLWHGENYKNVNMTKDTAHFVTDRDSCTLMVTDQLFK